ncbi:MAG: serine hydrolase domain-containing protein [Chloroflexota bacterium]|nr:MAG: hypothetical protein DIU80_02325 [Chloroflexota bacterium]
MFERIRIAHACHRYLRAQHALRRFSGVALLARGRQVLFERGYGLADAAHQVPNRPATRFRIGSQTKLFTAVAILTLADAGRLRVDDPIARFLPGYPRGEQITVHHLLSNTSGLPDYILAEDFVACQARPHSLPELIARFRDRPLLFEPGASFSYSNSGWILLGAIIEQISGLPYRDYLRQHVLVPAGLSQSGMASDDEVVPQHAAGYASLDPLQRAAHIANANQHAAGGMHATAGDLHRFWLALMDGRLISGESRALLTAAHAHHDLGGYGYGLLVGERHGRPYLEASGGTFGFVSVSAHYPAEALTVVVLANVEGAPFQAIADDLAAIGLGQPYDLPSARQFVAADPARFDDFTGRYELSFAGRRSVLEVRRAGAGLEAAVTGLRPAPMRALSDTRFLASMKGEVELEFVGPAGRPVEVIQLDWAGHPLTARRIVSAG